MLNKNEIITILLVSIVLGFVVSLVKSFNAFLYALLAVFLVLGVNIFAKKIAGYYLESEIEIKLWEISRYGWTAGSRFKKPIPAGILVPILVLVFSFGYVKWLGSLIFDVKPKIYRAAKRHGLYKFSEMTEWHLGLIAASGIIANIFFAIVGYLIGYSEFTRLNIYYAFFNILPLSNLDGNKIFFGSLVLWSFLVSLVIIGLLMAVFII
ncbi:MAG: hypothetical protein ABH804_02805 [archaeon]